MRTPHTGVLLGDTLMQSADTHHWCVSCRRYTPSGIPPAQLNRSGMLARPVCYAGSLTGCVVQADGQHPTSFVCAPSSSASFPPGQQLIKQLCVSTVGAPAQWQSTDTQDGEHVYALRHAPPVDETVYISVGGDTIECVRMSGHKQDYMFSRHGTSDRDSMIVQSVLDQVICVCKVQARCVLFHVALNQQRFS